MMFLMITTVRLDLNLFVNMLAMYMCARALKFLFYCRIENIFHSRSGCLMVGLLGSVEKCIISFLV